MAGFKVIENAEVVDDEATWSAEEQFDQWRDSLAQAQGNGTIRIYRLPMDDRNQPVNNQGSQILLETVPVDRFDLDGLCAYIRTRYMLPGEKFLAVRITGFRPGQRGIAFNRIVTLQRPNDDTSGDAPHGNPSSVELLRAVQEMTERSNARFEALMERLANARANNPPPDPMAQMTAMISALAPIMAAAAGRPVPEASSGLGAIKEAFGLLEMAKGLVPGAKVGNDDDDDGDTGTLGVVKAGIQALPALLQAMNQRPPVVYAPAPPQPRLPGPGAPVPPRASVPPQNIPPGYSQNPAPQNTGVNPNAYSEDEKKMLAEILKQLAQMSDVLDSNTAAGTPLPDAEKLAELFADNVPDDQVDKLAALLERADIMDTLASLHPRLNNHREWWATFIKSTAAQFEPDATP